ncbi:hypothetical protein HMPREF9431_00866 [Segatella oulorum F0390]|uniref:site-specific DNA-methyltransferase (adenine-specific) n=2 Tax=Segatella oulorum TaxID=28136 RepID=G1WAL5_9BACT|nr:hypothetical protein HMPREF9431_00866 [Segatella oulorum F0390]
MVMYSESISEGFINSIHDFYQEMAEHGQLENMNLKLVASLYALKYADTKGVLKKIHIQTILRYLEVKLEVYLSAEKIDNLLSHYTEVVDFCIFDEENNSRYRPYFVLPRELVLFCSKLLNLQKNSEVYYPFAGIGSFAVENPTCYFVGDEISPETWAIMQIYLDAHNVTSNIENLNPFDSLCRISTMIYDNIILTPPFGVKNSSYNEFDALSFTLNGLNGDGKMLAIMPASFCFSNSSKCYNIRRYLVENHYLSTVVLLPNIYFPNSNVNICVLLIEKKMSENPKDSFLLVDGRSYLSKGKRGKHYILDSDRLLDDITAGSKEGAIIKISSCDIDGDYNLTPGRYLMDTSNIENAVKLSDLIVVDAPHSHEGDVWIASDFSDDWNKCNLTLKKSDNKIRRRVITNNGNCIMVQYSHNRLMIGLVEGLPLNENISVGPLAIAFHVKDTQRISKKYLLYALKSKEVSIQAQVLATGDTLPRLSPRDFINIVISCPPILEQDRIIREAEDKYLQQLGLSRTSSDIAHMLGTPSVHIGNALKLLSLSQNLDERDKETLNYLKDNFEYMDRLVKLNSILDFSKLERKPICLAHFIECYISKWKSFGSNTFSISFDGDENALKAKVLANSDALMIMFDCLFDNANRHGFHKTKAPDNEVTIVLLSVLYNNNPCLMMRIGNNGAPLNKDFTLNDYITRGRFKSDSGRSGLGGYHVNAVVQSIGGETCPIISSSDWTAFEFRIPIVNAYELEKSKFLQ